MCGGTLRRPRHGQIQQGLSPRVRGNHCWDRPSLRPSRVYPRVCGGTGRDLGEYRGYDGLSPRVRGNHQHHYPGILHDGSIPACAGEPGIAFGLMGLGGVYPRVCGGTATSTIMESHFLGLSPRVRGNHHPDPQINVIDRSIPACAGEPWNGSCCTRTIWVYPRVCGGTQSDAKRRADEQGLSPRVRGNLRLRHLSHNSSRSIPACAGEP